MDEPVFLFDEEWEESRRDLQELLGEINDPKTTKNIYVLETFARACAFTFIKEKPKRFSLQELRKSF
ncbi:MAG: hypothetical protein AABX08_01340, partial [Nanoarchaeota archaeon]